MPRYLVITGASRGIGLATAERFLKEGYEVINLSRTPCPLEKVKHFTGDLLYPESLTVTLRELQYALPDDSEIVLVHNAGFYQPDDIKNTSLSVLNETMNVNVFSPIIINQYIIPKMKKGSSIVYLGSVLSERAVPGSASYSVSKHALVGLMRVTCQDLIEEGIRSNIILLGLVDTKLLHDTMRPDDVNYLLENVIIGKRLIQPREIAELILNCSHSAVLNGAIIDANLGQVAS